MSDYGFSIIFGHPLPPEFQAWVSNSRNSIANVDWNEVEAVHATIVNCTSPCGRSVQSKEDALSYKNALGVKLLFNLPQILQALSSISMTFDPVREAGRSIIVQTARNNAIADLKRVLQGGHECISEEEAEPLLRSPKVIGIDKFSSSQKSLQPVVAVTLGKSTQNFNAESLKAIPAAPGFKASGIHIAFYRDRNLHDVTTSDLLKFGDDMNNCTQIIRRFLDGIR